MFYSQFTFFCETLKHNLTEIKRIKVKPAVFTASFSLCLHLLAAADTNSSSRLWSLINDSFNWNFYLFQLNSLGLIISSVFVETFWNDHISNCKQKEMSHFCYCSWWTDEQLEEYLLFVWLIVESLCSDSFIHAFNPLSNVTCCSSPACPRVNQDFCSVGGDAGQSYNQSVIQTVSDAGQW